jgi:hypothetical protein
VAGKIFVNYRRDDSAANAMAIAQYLAREFGAHNVSIDIDHTLAGQEFPKALEQRLTKCRVMVTVIGPNWLHARDSEGRRRLDDPEDWVRLEIARALARDIRVIPVMVGGAFLPQRGDLPERLRPLLDRQARTVTTDGFTREMTNLAIDIRFALRPPLWRRLAPLVVIRAH